MRELDEDFRDGAGREYPHPLGRPNDREVEIPWRGEWADRSTALGSGPEPPEALLTSVMGDVGRVGPVFDRPKLDKIAKALDKRGIQVLVAAEGSDDIAYLNARGAGAVLMETESGPLMMLRENARRIEVVEELIHIGQRRKMGRAPSSVEESALLEIEAQDILLRRGLRAGWTAAELNGLRAARTEWLSRLERARSR
ncbi:MAG: hypothetical protein AMXMBFR64_23700 [Myxococcales bacterium]